jgi:hypothetical protein
MSARPLADKFLVAFSFAGEQRDLVRTIVEAVEEELGLGTVFFDEWFEYYIAGADADLKLQEIYGTRCELVVVCVSERYGGKPWTLAEHEAVRARQMKSRASTNKRERDAILPIRVGDGDVDGILFTTIVPDVRSKSTDATAQLIIDRLHLVLPDLAVGTGIAPAGPAWAEKPPALVWPMADHSGAREAFASLLTRTVPWRFLPLRGPSEAGKSHITRQMIANALPLAGVTCGRFDFKGTTSVDAELRSFVQFLQVPMPPSNLRLDEGLGRVLDSLKQRARPALLVFDTYEAAGDAQDWVDKQLLPNLLTCPWLRVVIAGQRVPSATGAIWALAARAPIQLEPPPPEDWLAFGQPHKPGLTLDFVRQAHQFCGGRASVLAQLLGPAM